MSGGISRRGFIGSTVVAGLATAAWPGVGWAHGGPGKLRHASIGVGGMGWGDLQQIGGHPDVEIVAICDVDRRRTEAARKAFPDARVYPDWRELFAKESDRLDSVNVTTPDHMHAPIAMTALAAGKHVYCQKPLTHEVHEARALTAAAAKAGVATQMGIQLSSTAGDRITVEWLASGVLGKVEEVWLWSNKDPWKYRPTGPRPAGEHAVPEGLDWDKWLGTAPARPFVPEVYHPTFWRGWQDFGVGWLGDMGCHIMHAPFRGLGLGAPISVRGEVEAAWRETPGRFTETWPTWQIVRYTYPGNELTAGDTLEVVWSDGDKYPPAELLERLGPEVDAYPEQGALVVGERGCLLHPHGGRPTLLPGSKFVDAAVPERGDLNHYHQWVDACLGRGETGASFDYAGPLTEAILLGTIALRHPERELVWDGEGMEFTNFAEANRLLQRTYRAGWEVEGL